MPRALKVQYVIVWAVQSDKQLKCAACSTTQCHTHKRLPLYKTIWNSDPIYAIYKRSCPKAAPSRAGLKLELEITNLSLKNSRVRMSQLRITAIELCVYTSMSCFELSKKCSCLAWDMTSFYNLFSTIYKLNILFQLFYVSCDCTLPHWVLRLWIICSLRFCHCSFANASLHKSTHPRWITST